MRYDAFSRLHPAVNFGFFLGAIGFGVVFQHPAYLLAGMVCSLAYHARLFGRKTGTMLLGMVPMFLLVSLLNPLLNTQGETVLFSYWGRPYTWEALAYGMALAAMFLVMLAWFGCYGRVLTSDKFLCLFGSRIPGLSLLLTMVLRLIPSFARKTRQIITARNSIGKGASDAGSFREKAASGAVMLSALTDWALEGSIVTADSMRSRGYGTAHRTSYQIYRMTGLDWVILALEGLLATLVLCSPGTAEYGETIALSPLNGSYLAYWTFLSIPMLLHWKEELQWRSFRSSI